MSANETGTRAVIGEIEQRVQSQVSVSEQLDLLIQAANRLGLYDAADWVRGVQSGRVVRPTL